MRQRQPGMGETRRPTCRSCSTPGAWSCEPDKVVGDPQAARQVQYPSGGRKQVVDYLPWLSLDAGSMNKGEVITAELNHVNLGLGRHPQAEGRGDHQVHAAAPVQRRRAGDRGRQGADVPRPVRDRARLQGGRRAAGDGGARSAARSSRRSSAKPEGDNDGPRRPGRGPEAGQHRRRRRHRPPGRPQLARRPGHVRPAVQVPVADNAGFVANALDYLVGSDALTDLRGRDVSVRPFTRVAEIRQAADLIGHYGSPAIARPRLLW